MMIPPGCREARHALGVYVLGSLDPAERGELDTHLATCVACRDELASLAGLPALLRKVPLAEAERLAEDAGDADAPEPSAQLLQRLLTTATTTRRARRWRELAAVAAVAVLALGGGAVIAENFTGGHQNPPAAGPVHEVAWYRVNGTDQATGVGMTVRYADASWGTQMKIQVSGAPAGVTCVFEVIGAGGQHLVSGSWQPGYTSERTWYQASTWLHRGQVRGFALMGNGKVLAQLPVSS